MRVFSTEFPSYQPSQSTTWFRQQVGKPLGKPAACSPSPRWIDLEALAENWMSWLAVLVIEPSIAVVIAQRANPAITKIDSCGHLSHHHHLWNPQTCR